MQKETNGVAVKNPTLDCFVDIGHDNLLHLSHSIYRTDAGGEKK